ncbi:MAG: toprim domain-containing protein, partial [Candidatus Eremiobacteraeota bacterium]|nr:toprim domain-containing protein [Candidatus Eremiobacteraeota bacterium]
FSLGYSPDRWDGLVNELMENGVDLEVALTAGLVRRGQHGFYDFYRGRLMIPTYATTGEVVAFGGRALDGSEPKYLNTSTTPVYTKGRGLYALERARRAAADAGGLIVVEGYLDCIALHQAGFTNAVAALGTAFTVEQAAELRKYAERVFIAFDADAAGAAAASKSIDVLIAAGCVAFVVQLGAGEDPDTFVRTHGRDAFAERIAGAVPWIQYKLDREIDELHESRLPAALAARSAEKMVRNLPSEEWDRWRVYAANRLGLAPDDLRRSRFIADAGSFAPRAGRATRHIAPAAEVPSIDRDVLEALLDEPSLVEEYRERIPATIFRDERYRAVYERLLDTGSTVTTTADVFAAFADDRNSVDMLVALQKGDRSSKVRFADSASRRAQLDRIVEWLEERCLIARKRELDAAIGRLYESGLPIPDADREELDALVKRLDRSSAKRLGTK